MKWRVLLWMVWVMWVAVASVAAFTVWSDVVWVSVPIGLLWGATAIGASCEVWRP